MNQTEQNSFLDYGGLVTLTSEMMDFVEDKVSSIAGISVDTELSTSSTNPVQNKVVTSALNEKANSSDFISHTNNADVHVSSSEKIAWDDANNKKHEHNNSEILDNTTAIYTAEEKEKLNKLNMNPAGETLGLIQSGGDLTISNGIATFSEQVALIDCEDNETVTDAIIPEGSLHVHDNKDVLDKLSESADGILLFNGNEIQGGTGNVDLSKYATIEFVNNAMKNINLEIENEDIDFSVDY